jgi:hypothetical protein
MKNIHLIPTDKPTRLYKHNELGFELLAPVEHEIGAYNGSNQHIYITNGEEIKDGDWMIRGNEQPTLVTPNFFWDFGVRYYKIILTTDPDLIKDGVQKIDDEFLQWFVKNPSCEVVEVDKIPDLQSYNEKTYKCELVYTITIPQEEPKQTLEKYEQQGMEKYAHEFKQETLEEAKLRQLFKNRSNCYADTGNFENDGSYSEGEVIQAMDEDCFINTVKEWFEQFKKK